MGFLTQHEGQKPLFLFMFAVSESAPSLHFYYRFYSSIQTGSFIFIKLKGGKPLSVIDVPPHPHPSPAGPL